MTSYLLALVREDDLRGDPWGTAMAWHFAIADRLWADGHYVPAEWQYSHGASAWTEPEADDFYGTECVGQSAEDLLHAGNVLHRFEALCVLAGRDY